MSERRVSGMHTKTWDDLKSGAEEKEEKKERKRNCGSLDVEVLMLP